MHAAQELLQLLLQQNIPKELQTEQTKKDLDATISKMSHLDIAIKLRELCGSEMVAITVGGEGCVLSVGPSSSSSSSTPATTTSSHAINLALKACPIDKVLDATGAGDAFLGGLVAAFYQVNIGDDNIAVKNSLQY
jgi:sugar/nucleoside kinase (ribokinase family)